MRNGPKLNDTLYIDDGRAVNPDESHGIEMAGELVQCGPVKQLFTARVQIHINSCAFNPIDLGYANEARGATGFHHKAINVAASLWPSGQHAQDSAAKLMQTELTAASLGAGKRGFPAFIAEWFQQIVQRICFKGADGVRIVGSDKYSEWHRGRTYGFNNLQTIELGHLHIKKDEVQRLAPDDLHRSFSVCGLQHASHLRIFPEQVDQTLPRGRFII